ncbi:SET domain-containing protein [Neolentinus lepideus HHB14362 ss-1]|uniref:SET domain-containing protein n=1 Tax=Neolentinus lepideus HHB14362 ss-1 TaxID=1314782 RepID=A0A165SB15_9AGAM|nr:SET domain-containing protein [Neolentinus lepideus HHB14362 ss-1]
MYSILTKLFAVVSFLVLAFAAPMPGGSDSTTSQCNIGALQCCGSTQEAGSPGHTAIVGLLGVAADLLNLPIGLDCSPLTGGGIGSGATCASLPVCCQDTSTRYPLAVCLLPLLGKSPATGNKWEVLRFVTVHAMGRTLGFSCHIAEMSLSHTDPSFDISLYPQVTVRLADENGQIKGRGLFASTLFEPGQLIFKERPILHTSISNARSFIPTPELEIPYDWQRLLYLYSHFRRHRLHSNVLDSILTDLSLDGVCSDPARDADPDWEPEVREWAEEWVQWYNSQNLFSQWKPTSEEIFRLIAILETNSHSRDEDDMRDLQDPRSDAQNILSTNMDVDMNINTSVATGEDEQIKDEACGLWIMASMLNHSCLPNCTVFIPPTKRTGEESILYLRCIRPVSAGEELLISYHDEEFLPTLDRQAMLMPRGFKCHCPLCSGHVREYMRSAACSNSSCAGGQGTCCPVMIDGEMRWVCDRCNRMLSEDEVAAVEEKEEQWMGEWEQILAMTSGEIPATQCTHLLAYQVIQHLADSWIISFPNDSQLPSLPNLSFLFPLHPNHSHIYSFLKYILFEQSVWLRQYFADAGVHGVLLAMLAIVEHALNGLGDGGNSLKVSEERRVLGYWIVKEAERQLGQDQDEKRAKWESIRDQGFMRWQIGMRYLCSTE